MNESIGGVRNRRSRALERLQSQLKSGKKPSTRGRNYQYEVMMDLTESDIKRINSEMETLKSRL